MTGFIMAGVLREELGFEGYGEALRRRWFEADMEQSGMVTITNNLGMIEDIRTLAKEFKAESHESTCKCGGKNCDCKCKEDGSDCKCTSVKESETAHFFAQAHAFRRNASVGVNEVVGDPEGDMTHGVPAFGKRDRSEEFINARLPDLKRHFLTSQKILAYPPEQRARLWNEFLPELLQFSRTSPLVKQLMASYGDQPFESVPLQDVNKLCEVATLGLGRTGDAPDMPVPGLGASSAAPTQRPPNQPMAPASTAYQQPVSIGSDVAVVENGKQYVGKVSRTLPDGKYEISFAGDQPPVRRSYDKTEVSTSAASAVTP